MRVFLCAFGNFFLAIPMSSVSSMTLNTDMAAQRKAVEYNNENRNTYVSLPRLFNLPSENIRHGIILQSGEEDSETTEDKIILLSNEVICETEIPCEEIYPIPKALGGMRFSAFFRGILFDSGTALTVSENSSNCPPGSPVLLLDIEQLVQRIL